MVAMCLRFVVLKTSAIITRTSDASFSTTASVLRHNALLRRPIGIVKSYDDKKAIPLDSVDKNVIPHEKDLRVKTKTGDALISSTGEVYVPFPRYEKLVENDARFTKILTILRTKIHRDHSGKVLLEGVRLINDAINAGVKPQMLFFSKDKVLTKITLHLIPEVKLYKVFYKTLQVWSSLTTSPGIMGIFNKPSADDLSIMTEPALPVTVLAHNIQDPRIMGSIVRNAAAIGCKAVLFTSDCMDVWKQNVLRSGCGAHFRIPIVNDIPWSQVTSYLHQDSTIYLVNTEYNSEEEDVYVDYDEELAYNSEDKLVTSDAGVPIITDEKYEDPEHLEKYDSNLLTNSSYYDLKFPKDHIILCVSEGKYVNNSQVIKLAHEFGGQKLKIPVENQIRLNAALALPVVLSEIRRQCVETYVTKLQ